LLEVTALGQWEAWLLYMLRAVEDTSRWTTAKIRAMRTLLGRAATHIRERAPKIYSRELVDLIFEQPYCRIGNVVAAGIARRQTAAEYLGQLVDVGVLTSVHSGREKLFMHRALLDLLAADAHDAPPYGSHTAARPAGELPSDVQDGRIDVNRSASIDRQ